jgi:hypothetical protein
MKSPKFNIGDKVRVNHPLGTWEGEVVNSRLPDDEWEYEVSNSLEQWPYSDGKFMWWPLAWESQVEVV